MNPILTPTNQRSDSPISPLDYVKGEIKKGVDLLSKGTDAKNKSRWRFGIIPTNTEISAKFYPDQIPDRIFKVTVRDRRSLCSPERTFDMNLVELIQFLIAHIPDSVGYVGDYYVDDIVRFE